MRSVLIGAVGMVVAVGLWSSRAEAADPGEIDVATLVVRTYTPPEMEGSIRTARRTASGILHRARIQVEWLECGLPSARPESTVDCSQPLQPNELVVRMVSAGTVATTPDAETLGFAFVDIGAGGGSLATVYADRVRAMAQAAGVSAAELMGRTIAHEVGHLLLGTNRHAAQGLMRASWSGADLRSDRATHWLFDRREGDIMRRGILARGAASRLSGALSYLNDPRPQFNARR